MNHNHPQAFRSVVFQHAGVHYIVSTQVCGEVMVELPGPLKIAVVVRPGKSSTDLYASEVHEVPWFESVLKIKADLMCTDCGTAAQHEDSIYCRRCAIRSDNGDDFYVDIDKDKLRALVGREQAQEIINRCGFTGQW